VSLMCVWLSGRHESGSSADTRRQYAMHFVQPPSEPLRLTCPISHYPTRRRFGCPDPPAVLPNRAQTPNRARSLLSILPPNEKSLRSRACQIEFGTNPFLWTNHRGIQSDRTSCNRISHPRLWLRLGRSKLCDSQGDACQPAPTRGARASLQ
jgi:hypothetical protein